jgi:hypothetical protein
VLKHLLKKVRGFIGVLWHTLGVSKHSFDKAAQQLNWRSFAVQPKLRFGTPYLRRGIRWIGRKLISAILPKISMKDLLFIRPVWLTSFLRGCCTNRLFDLCQCKDNCDRIELLQVFPMYPESVLTEPGDVHVGLPVYHPGPDDRGNEQQ